MSVCLSGCTAQKYVFDACVVEGRGRSRASRGLCCAYRLVEAPLLVANLTPLVVWTRIVLSIHGSRVLSGHRIVRVCMETDLPVDRRT